MEATLTLSQAGRQLGVADDALSRLIRTGSLPEARQETTAHGPVWLIPTRDLPSIAARNGWNLDLRGPRAAVSPPAAAQVPPVDRTAPRRGAAAGTDVIPARADATSARTDLTQSESDSAPSVGEVIDLALLDRLLGAQEQRVVAESQARETRSALTALNTAHNRVTSELEIERHERMVATDRYREERLARAAADAKVTELRNRVTREMALAEAERQAKADALHRSIRAERDAANALAAMGWLARRRYRRLGEEANDR